LIEGHGVGPEVGDNVDFFEPDDGEVFGGEGVLASVLGRAGFTFGSARSGGLCGVGAVGSVTVGLGHGGFLAFRVSTGVVWVGKTVGRALRGKGIEMEILATLEFGVAILWIAADSNYGITGAGAWARRIAPLAPSSTATIRQQGAARRRRFAAGDAWRAGPVP